MARKRMIDPGIWTSEDFANLSMLARLVWVGLISNADDEGRGKANTAYLKSQLFPYDDELSLKKIDSARNLSCCLPQMLPATSTQSFLVSMQVVRLSILA